MDWARERLFPACRSMLEIVGVSAMRGRRVKIPVCGMTNPAIRFSLKTCPSRRIRTCSQIPHLRHRVVFPRLRRQTLGGIVNSTPFRPSRCRYQIHLPRPVTGVSDCHLLFRQVDAFDRSLAGSKSSMPLNQNLFKIAAASDDNSARGHDRSAVTALRSPHVRCY